MLRVGDAAIQGQGGDSSEFVPQQMVSVPSYDEEFLSPHSAGALTSPDYFGIAPPDHGRISSGQQERPLQSRSIDSYPLNTEEPLPKKQKRAHLEIQHERIPDFIATGLISLEQAQTFFDT
jgi:hypothetical protein